MTLLLVRRRSLRHRGAAAVFHPSQISDVRLVADPAAEAALRGLGTGDTAVLSTWDDTSGQGNTMGQAGGGMEPTLQYSNGRWVAAFDGSNDYMYASNIIALGNQAHTFIALFRPTSVSSFYGVLTEGYSDGDGLTSTVGFQLGGAVAWYGGSNRGSPTGSGVPAGVDVILAKTFDGTLGAGYFNGVHEGVSFATAYGFTEQVALIGRHQLTGASAPMHFCGGIIAARALTGPERRACEEWLKTLAASSVLTPADRNMLVFCAGDSLTYGYGLSAGQDYPSLLAGSITNSTILNYGLIGQTAAEILAAVSTRSAPKFAGLTTGDYPGGRVYVLWAGTNDWFVGSPTAASIYSDLQDIAAAIRAVGGLVVMATMLPRGSVGSDRLDLNTLIRAGEGADYDALADVAADARIGDDGDNADTTYYQSDAIHLNATGMAVAADIILAAIESVTP